MTRTPRSIPAGRLSIVRPHGSGGEGSRALTITVDTADRARHVAHLEIRQPGGSLSPGFSLTGETYEPRGTWSGEARQRNGREWDMGGARGEAMAALIPELSAFDALHLSDLDGTPMHGAANAAYFLSGKAERYELETYGPSYAERHGTGYERACRIMRVDSIPAACWTDEGEAMTTWPTWRNGDGFQHLYTARTAGGPAWDAFVQECRTLWAYEAADALALFDDLYRRALDHRVSAILRTDNPAEPGGEWSTWDLSQRLNGTNPATACAAAMMTAADQWHALAVESVSRLCPGGGRYVGGTSGHLYSMPPLGTYSVRPAGAGFAVMRENGAGRVLARMERTRADAEHVAAQWNAAQPQTAGVA